MCVVKWQSGFTAEAVHDRRGHPGESISVAKLAFSVVSLSGLNTLR